MSRAVAAQDVKMRILENAYAKSARVAQFKQIQEVGDPQGRLTQVGCCQGHATVCLGSCVVCVSVVSSIDGSRAMLWS